MLLSGCTSFFIPNPNYLRPFFFTDHLFLYVIKSNPNILLYVFFKNLDSENKMTAAKILQSNGHCMQPWFQCVYSPTSENMSATMLAFILRSKGASLKYIYFGRGKERKTENEKVAHIQGQPHESTSKNDRHLIKTVKNASSSQRGIFKTYFSVTKLKGFFCLFVWMDGVKMDAVRFIFH